MNKLQVSYEVSERRALNATGFPRASHRYQSVKDERADLRIKLKDLAASRVHYGYRRLHILLQREGWQVNHKLVYRIYKEEGLTMRAPNSSVFPKLIPPLTPPPANHIVNP